MAALLFCAGLGTYGSVAALRWDPVDLGGSSGARAPALGHGELRAVTFNAWKLAQPARVPGYLEALRTTGDALGTSERGSLPELFAVQELESREVIRALADAVRETHEVTVCECAVESDGSLRSAVAIAADRRFFTQRAHRCIGLDRVWPDHPRCAAEVELEHDGRTLRAVGVHLAWHVDNSSMASRLRAAIEPSLASGDPLILLGDLNTWPGSSSYATLARAPLDDPFEDAPATHFTGNRLDYVLPSRGLRVVRGLDRRASFDALDPSAALTLPSECARGRSAACPVSDHLPEGAVIALPPVAPLR